MIFVLVSSSAYIESVRALARTKDPLKDETSSLIEIYALYKVPAYEFSSRALASINSLAMKVNHLTN